MLRRSFVAAALGAAALPGLARAQAAFTLGQITPENELERAFLGAFNDASLRPAFRHELLRANVALALANDAPDSPPRLLDLANDRGQAGLIFTSAARLSGVLGPAAPRAVLQGRDALARLTGKNVILNYRLSPVLTLEAEDIASYLAEPQ